MKGKTKQPTALAKLKGTYQPCRYETGMDEKLTFVYDYLPTPPPQLDEIAVYFWNTQLSQAQKINGYISNIDLHFFAELCELYSEIQKVKSSIKNIFIVDDKGNEKINPRQRHLNDLRRQYAEYSREFGFTPASRSKVKIQDVPPPKEQEEFIL